MLTYVRCRLWRFVNGCYRQDARSLKPVILSILSIPSSHYCTATCVHELYVVFSHPIGVVKVSVQWCQHLSVVEQLFRHDIFPGSPRVPTVAYSVDFLDYFYHWQHEAKVPANAFMASMLASGPSIDTDDYDRGLRSTAYKNVMAASEQYQIMIRARDSVLQIASKNKCPCCEGRLAGAFMIDGCMGLNGFESTSRGDEEPCYSGLDQIFIDDAEVEKLTSMLSTVGGTKVEVHAGCSNFTAASQRPSVSKHVCLELLKTT